MMILRVIVAMIIAVGVGKLFSRFKMPAILGWLVTGMIIGPFGFKIMNNELLSLTSYKTLISILECVVGIMIGSELVIRNLKKSGKDIVVTTLFQSLGTFLVVTGCFFVVFHFMNIPGYLAVVFGAIALATAPAPALSIIQEFDTKGPVTDALVPMAALDDIVGMIVFFTVISIVGSSDASRSLVSTLLLMIGLPAVIGISIGSVWGFIMNHIKSNIQLTVVLVSGLLLTSVVGLYVNTVIIKEPMVNFMLLGMAFSAAFVNILTPENMERVLNIAKPMIGFSIILVILNLGAPLNYTLIFGAGALTFVYISSRMFGKYFGARLGAKVCKMPTTVQKYLGLTLLPHSGVSLVFTGIAVAALMPTAPELALILQGTIAAAAIINEVIAVLVSKKAFEWAGEINNNTVN